MTSVKKPLSQALLSLMMVNGSVVQNFQKSPKETRQLFFCASSVPPSGHAMALTGTQHSEKVS